MKVLVACEESQRVCIEFRRLGHEAYSCDILPCSGGHPEWHIQDNVLKHLDGWECAMAFSSIKFNADNTKWALGAADISNVTGGLGIKKIVPRGEVRLTDFSDLWWVGDKADGGAFAIKLINGLSTGGLNIQSTKNGKGTNQMTITGHVSLANQDVMPMEFYDIPAPEGSATEYSYTAVTPVGTENPAEEGWYVLVGDSYRLTNDTEVDSNVTYYEKESV